jgi:hypothetical protein
LRRGAFAANNAGVVTGKVRLSEAEPQQGSAELVDFFGPSGPQPPRPKPFVGFDRRELNTILGLYGRKVAGGEWRDYAMDFLKDRALFSIYRRASERPLYVIEKNPKLRGRQGQYLVTGQQGRVLKRGHDLDVVLRELELAVVR